jgi:hypothetical protein
MKACLRGLGCAQAHSSVSRGLLTTAKQYLPDTLVPVEPFTLDREWQSATAQGWCLTDSLCSAMANASWKRKRLIASVRILYHCSFLCQVGSDQCLQKGWHLFARSLASSKDMNAPWDGERCPLVTLEYVQLEATSARVSN